MNNDLYMRLKPYSNLSRGEVIFWRVLCKSLGERAMCYAPALDKDMKIEYFIEPGERAMCYAPALDKDMQIEYFIEPIENGEDDSAYLLGDGSEFEVYIDDRMPFGMMIDFLIHELAHVQSWHCDESPDDVEDFHGPEFGIAYADLYDHYLALYDAFWGDL